MVWQDPTTRQTGDLITAAIWNQDVVDNTRHLHTRTAAFYLALAARSSGGSAGDFRGANLRGNVTGDFVVYNGQLPVNMATLEAVHMLGVGRDDGSILLNAEAAYGSVGELRSAHTRAVTGLVLPFLEDQLVELDLTSLFVEAGPGDLFAVRVETASSSSQTLVAIMLRVRCQYA
ncbi:MAG: hypothetical protein GYB64_13525 [Chloroflexi bacterium]|nr:hypothetical protein [Chloroflexota bacterium]